MNSRIIDVGYALIHYRDIIRATHGPLSIWFYYSGSIIQHFQTPSIEMFFPSVNIFVGYYFRPLLYYQILSIITDEKFQPTYKSIYTVKNLSWI